ncbi:MAG TPA: M50 family metallopeptidase [Thermoanaerobaculia bacterium]|nr:M50 family metallopeptidase [Thermoanaerobaculia bacterium]
MLNLGSIGGTSIRIDFNFIILIVFFVALNYNAQLGIHYALLWIPILFISVLIHELAHAGTIGAFGFGASEIVLTGMGGVTMNRRKAKPWQDMLISLAGPISSFALMFLCKWIYESFPIAHTDKMLDALLPRLVLANLFWGIFNLIPIAPLDGGHAVREFLRIFLRDRTAFIVYVWIAMVVGGGVAVAALFLKQFFIGLYIAWFVYIAFQQWQYFRQYGTPGD